jgi:hypothetical protein
MSLNLKECGIDEYFSQESSQDLGYSTSYNLDIHNLWPFSDNLEVYGNGNLLHKFLVHSSCLVTEHAQEETK